MSNKSNIKIEKANITGTLAQVESITLIQDAIQRDYQNVRGVEILTNKAGDAVNLIVFHEDGTWTTASYVLEGDTLNRIAVEANNSASDTPKRVRPPEKQQSADADE